MRKIILMSSLGMSGLFLINSALAENPGQTAFQTLPNVKLNLGQPLMADPTSHAYPIVDIAEYAPTVATPHNEYYKYQYNNCEGYTMSGTIADDLQFIEYTSGTTTDYSCEIAIKPGSYPLKESNLSGCKKTANGYQCNVTIKGVLGQSQILPIQFNTRLYAKSTYQLVQPRVENTSYPYYPVVSMTESDSAGSTISTVDLASYFSFPSTDTVKYTFDASNLCSAGSNGSVPLCGKLDGKKNPIMYIGGIGSKSTSAFTEVSDSYGGDAVNRSIHTSNPGNEGNPDIYVSHPNAQGQYFLNVENLVQGVYQINVKATDTKTGQVAYQTFYLDVNPTVSFSDWKGGQVATTNLLGYNSAAPGQPLQVDRNWTGVYMYVPDGRDGGGFDIGAVNLNKDLANYRSTIEYVNKNDGADIKAVYNELSDMQFAKSPKTGEQYTGYWPVDATTHEPSPMFSGGAPSATNTVDQPLDFTTYITNLMDDNQHPSEPFSTATAFLNAYQNHIGSMADLSIDFGQHIDSYPYGLTKDMYSQLSDYLAYTTNKYQYQGIVFDPENSHFDMTAGRAVYFWKQLSDRLAYQGKTLALFNFPSAMMTPYTTAALGPLGFFQVSSYDSSDQPRYNVIKNSPAIGSANQTVLESALNPAGPNSDHVCTVHDNPSKPDSHDDAGNPQSWCNYSYNESYFSNITRWSEAKAASLVKNYNAKYQVVLPMANSASENAMISIWNIDTSPNKAASYMMRKQSIIQAGTTPINCYTYGKAMVNLMSDVDVTDRTDTHGDKWKTDCTNAFTAAGQGNLAPTFCALVANIPTDGWNWGGASNKQAYPIAYIAGRQCFFEGQNDYVTATSPVTSKIVKVPVQKVEACSFPENARVGTSPSGSNNYEVPYSVCVDFATVPGTISPSNNIASSLSYLPKGLIASTTKCNPDEAKQGTCHETEQYYWYTNMSAFDPNNSEQSSIVEPYSDPHRVGYGLFALEKSYGFANGAFFQQVGHGYAAPYYSRPAKDNGYTTVPTYVGFFAPAQYTVEGKYKSKYPSPYTAKGEVGGNKNPADDLPQLNLGALTNPYQFIMNMQWDGCLQVSSTGACMVPADGAQSGAPMTLNAQMWIDYGKFRKAYAGANTN